MSIIGSSGHGLEQAELPHCHFPRLGFGVSFKNLKFLSSSRDDQGWLSLWGGCPKPEPGHISALPPLSPIEGDLQTHTHSLLLVHVCTYPCRHTCVRAHTHIHTHGVDQVLQINQALAPVGLFWGHDWAAYWRFCPIWDHQEPQTVLWLHYNSRA